MRRCRPRMLGTWRWPAIAALLLSAQLVAKSQTVAGPGGIFNEEQAIRGQALYYAHCLNCHGEDMSGLDQAPPLAGPQFSAVWSGETLWALVQRLETMPPTEPGSLTREDNVALLAYMLWYNRWPIGEAPLGTEQSRLAELSFMPPTTR